MGVLVDDLLLLARLDQGRPLAAAPVRLDRIAEDACRDARAVSPEHTVDADLEAVCVTGDEARLRQVVANLLTNATAHTPAGSSVRVRVASVGGCAVLEVTDDGPGLTAEQAATVFDRFSRVDDGRNRATGGSGLGLSIAAAIAEAHHGRITLRTSPGAGCTFRVELPDRPTT